MIGYVENLNDSLLMIFNAESMNPKAFHCRIKKAFDKYIWVCIQFDLPPCRTKKSLEPDRGPKIGSRHIYQSSQRALFYVIPGIRYS
jgi:hypothetical protein